MANTCPIDGTKIGMLGGWDLIDGTICNKCGKLVGLNHSEPRAEIIAHSYTIDEIKQLIEDGDLVSQQHLDKYQKEQHEIKAAQKSSGEGLEDDNTADFFERLDLSSLEPHTKAAVIKSMSKMSDLGLARVLGTINGVTQRYQVTMNQTQIEQNWILIKQQDETNKLLRKLIDMQNENS